MKEVKGLGMLVFRISYFCYPDSVCGKNEVSFFKSLPHKNLCIAIGVNVLFDYSIL